MTISQAIEKLEKLNLEEALGNAIEQTEEQYEDLNRSQLFAGMLSDNSPLTPPYSARYIPVRQRAGLQVDHVDLKFTGAFYKGFTLELEGETLQLGSDVEYEGSLSARYTQKIYGLTDENMKAFKEIIRPILIGEVKGQYYGG